MRLESIHLTNYRRFADLDVDFGGRFNVIVGVNGSGKTSLLSAIADAVNAGFAPAGLGGEPGNALPMFGERVPRVERINVDGRVRFERRFPVVLTPRLHAFGATWNWSVSRAPSDQFGQGTSDMLGFSNAMRAHINAFPFGDPLPLVAYYRANRRWPDGTSDMVQAATKKEARADAYSLWMDAALDLPNLKLWIIAKYLARLQRSTDQGISFDEIAEDELAALNRAIASVVTGSEGVRFDMSEHSLLMLWTDGRVTPFDNLSDGQRSAIYLVADITRRMCLLNPQLGPDVLRKTPGIVIIDELDIHLHPAWQRMMVIGLRSAFSQIQFIVASHSPQVLSELSPDEIIVLNDDEALRPQESYGMDSSRILEAIMDAPSRPEEVQESLDRVFELLERQDLQAARARIDELRTRAPGVAELGRAEALLRRKELLGK